MLRKTRIRLTAILSIITGAILTSFFAFSVDSTVNAKIQSLQDTMLRNLELCKSKMYTSNGSTDWIEDFEKMSKYKVFVEKKSTILSERSNSEDDNDFLKSSSMDEIKAIVERYDLPLSSTENDGEAVFFNISYIFRELFISVATTSYNDGEIDFNDDQIITGEMIAFPHFEASHDTNITNNPTLSSSVVEYYLTEDAVITDTKSNKYALNSASISIDDTDDQNIVIMLAPLSEKENSIRQIYLQYITIGVFGVILICVANWFLSKFILYPAEQSMKEQKEFIAAAHHELRSPLAVVSASLDVMEDTSDEEMLKKYRNNAKNEVTRMGRLVNDLLILSGSSFNKWRVKKTESDIDTLLIDVAEQYAPIAEIKQIQLSLDLPDDVIGTAYIDNDRIKQILHVLLDNAFSYCPKGSNIKLSCKKHKNKINFVVADSGNGIADEEKEKIFRKFYRTDKSRTEKSHFGLGLPVALELTQMHSGTLSITDTLGGGATFTLSIPVGRKNFKK